MLSADNSLEPKILNWLNTQGYPLEMWVASKLEASDFIATLSDYYRDPKTQELREIDVTGWVPGPITRDFIVEMYVRIECKLSRDKPWIAFMRDSDSTLLEWPIVPPYAIGSETYNKFWFAVGLNSGTIFPEYSKLVTCSVPEPVQTGHSLVQTKFGSDSNTDVAFKALTSAVNASLAVAKDRDDENAGNKKNQKWYCVAIPAIVIDGQLFECIQRQEDMLNLREVHYTSVRWKGIQGIHGDVAPIVHVCTRAGLADFLSRLVQARAVITEVFNNQHLQWSNQPKSKSVLSWLGFSSKR